MRVRAPYWKQSTLLYRDHWFAKLFITAAPLCETAWNLENDEDDGRLRRLCYRRALTTCALALCFLEWLRRPEIQQSQGLMVVELDPCAGPWRHVLEERQRQQDQYGEAEHYDLMWFMLFAEELFEANQCIVHASPTKVLYHELVQATALLVAWIETLPPDHLEIA